MICASYPDLGLMYCTRTVQGASQAELGYQKLTKRRIQNLRPPFHLFKRDLRDGLDVIEGQGKEAHILGVRFLSSIAVSCSVVQGIQLRAKAVTSEWLMHPRPLKKSDLWTTPTFNPFSVMTENRSQQSNYRILFFELSRVTNGFFSLRV